MLLGVLFASATHNPRQETKGGNITTLLAIRFRIPSEALAHPNEASRTLAAGLDAEARSTTR